MTREEIISMIKWIREEYEPEFANGRYWVDILEDDPEPVTDEQLYELYLQWRTQNTKKG